MPELPDVELLKKRLEPKVTGRRFEGAKVLRKPVGKKRNPDENELKRLSGKKIEGVKRRGKFLIFSMDGSDLIFHFRMTGDLLLDSSDKPLEKNTRLIFRLDDDEELRFVDRRNIGEIYLAPQADYSSPELRLLAKMGVEPLSGEFSFEFFQKLLEQNSGRPIKALLMDQKKIAGIGNVYSDEVLYQSDIKPDRLIDKLGPKEKRQLYDAIKGVLEKAVGFGEKAYEYEGFLLANRSGRKCRKCGGNLVRKKIGGRTSVYCEKHQI